MNGLVDPARWPEADELLDRALALPASERDAFLRASAGQDPELLASLRCVIAEATAGDEFLAPGGALSGALGAEIEAATRGEEPQALHPGDRIEQYEIAGIIGRGGMGEVYLARDMRLPREVALKVLPERLARDPEGVARFRREARTLASLNHPGIGSIYGVAEDRVREALVLELVEGPTLAERLAGRALPLEETLSIARRLAEAIEAAHARGILHRDLKPANIKVKSDGAVKILDFGLAKALAAEPGSPDAEVSSPDSPVILGTAAYMSPEQVRGEALDERTDIWAFGCVLFEMLTGRRAFAGNTRPEVIAHVLKQQPDFSQVPAATPAPIRRLLKRCLEKNPRRRLGFIGDAILELDDAVAEDEGIPAAGAGRSLPPLAARAWPLMAALLAIGAFAGVVLVLFLGSRPPEPQVARFTLTMPSGDVPFAGFQPMVAFSPDGQTVVYRARRNGVVQLFRRLLQELDPTPIPGTENGTSPFFSPDGRWLGFDSDGVLKRLEFAGGGNSVVICDAPGGVTAAWRNDDTIVFATNTGRVLQHVAASGGQPSPLTTLDQSRGDTLHLLPQHLPDGSILFTVVSGASRHFAVRLGSGEVRILGEGTNARYLRSGHIVFSRDGSLWVAPFELQRLALAAPAVPVPIDIRDTDNTVLHFDVAGDGSLVYVPAGEDGSVQRLVWIDREGVEAPVNLEPRPYVRIGLSPDGTRVAYALRERGNTDVWVADTARNVINRLTFDPTIETMPTWSPDSRRVAFRSEREGPGIFHRDAQGAGPIERLTETDGPIHSPYSWTPDGKTLLFAVFRSFRHQAIASVTPPDRRIRVLLDGNFAQIDPQVSPDGRWLAYQSDESGRFEVYVRPYPDVQSGRWQVSTRGGTSPRWAPDGHELFFVAEDGLYAMPVASGPSGFVPRPAKRLFEVKPFGGRLGADFEVAPDGRRFLFILAGPPSTTTPAHLVYVQNWVRELRARLAERH